MTHINKTFKINNNTINIYIYTIMEDLTIGQILGIFPMYSKIPTRYQYFSKIHKVWSDCHESELKAYDKYGYITRTI